MLTARARARQSDPTTLPVHPILAGAYFVLFLFAENLADQLTLGPLWGPLLFAIVAATLALGAGIVVMRDARRGALLATLAIVLFFTFGHVWYMVDEALVARRWLIAGYALVALGGSLLIWRGGAWVAPLTRVLNVGVGALVAFNAIGIATFAADDPLAEVATATPIALAADGGERRPDIYYIVLDRYANGWTMDHLYGHDNEPFLDDLRDRGFAIAGEAWANYFKTHLSLTSSLNMDFVDGATLASEAERMEDGREFVPINARLSGPLVGPVTLQSLGYEYVHVGTWYPATAGNAAADVTINYGDGLEFSTALVETTALSLLSPSRPERSARTIYTPTIVRQFHEYSFDQLAASAERDGPTFVFAHFQLPHPPYVYTADGGAPTWHEQQRPEPEQYVDQVRYTNDRVLETIDQIIATSEDEPVIVLMADEGPFPEAYAADERGFDWLEATPEQVAQKFGILNAMRLPGVDAEDAGLHPRSSPVNTLRIVLNAYFGAELPLLPDSIFLSPSHANPYAFVTIERTADGTPILTRSAAGAP